MHKIQDFSNSITPFMHTSYSEFCKKEFLNYGTLMEMKNNNNKKKLLGKNNNRMKRKCKYSCN